jgi:H+/Cl- antiporter ClcA
MGSLDFIVSLTAGLALTTLVALFITGWMLRDRFRESQGNEADPILARISHGNVRREAFRVNELLAFTALIVTVILGIETVASGRLLILIVLLYLTANSILDRLEYTATYQMIREKLHSGEVSK